jgi:hypothetical protein
MKCLLSLRPARSLLQQAGGRLALATAALQLTAVASTMLAAAQQKLTASALTAIRAARRARRHGRA